MTAHRRVLLALGAWLLGCSAGAAGLEDLDACAVQAATQSRGIAALEAECPGLETALREVGVVENLPEGWRETLDRDALGDLAGLVHRYHDAAVPAAALEPGDLRAILEQLERERVKPARSWWDAVKEWLRSWSGNQDSRPAPWLVRLLSRLAQSADVIKMISYVLLGLTVVAAIMFVVNELRVAGVLSRRRESWRGDGVPAVQRATERMPTIADLDAAALRDQPGILLRLLVSRLLETRQLHAERNLTHRELVTQCAFPDVDSRARFARVSQLAERVLYGAGEDDPAQSTAVIADGRGLLLQLQTTGNPAP
jgi:hypothetical protein